MKPDESKLLVELLRVRPNQSSSNFTAEDIGATLDIHAKRVGYILKKWTGRGWWNYGVSPRTGWLTKGGLLQAEIIVLESRVPVKARVMELKPERGWSGEPSFYLDEG